jgi:hypothetical protein
MIKQKRSDYMPLKNRGRKGFILPLELIQWLEGYSKETDIPESRIVERALKEYKEKLESK